MDKTAIKSEMTALNASAMLCIDGMVDEVWELVSSRKSDTEINKMANMIELGNAITERKTGGMATERVLKRRISGGFVCNTGRAVAKLGLKTSLLGMFGENSTESIFDEFNGLADIYSLGAPSNIQILEFTDGKIMMPNLERLINLKWENILDKYSMERVEELLNNDIIGVGYWSNMYDFENILANMVKIAKQNGKTKRFFHDFANLNKRTPEALMQALETLKTQDAILPQTLSLNEHEGGILCKALGIDYPENINDPASMQAALKAVEKAQVKIGIDEVIIHSLYFAVMATKTKGSSFAMQNYCENPVKTTGAGDTFNGGYMTACLTNLKGEEKLAFANATTYCYVATGNAPTMQQVIDEINSK